jgi:hypothetical protein
MRQRRLILLDAELLDGSIGELHLHDELPSHRLDDRQQGADDQTGEVLLLQSGDGRRCIPVSSASLVCEKLRSARSSRKVTSAGGSVLPHVSISWTSRAATASRVG